MKEVQNNASNTVLNVVANYDSYFANDENSTTYLSVTDSQNSIYGSDENYVKLSSNYSSVMLLVNNKTNIDFKPFVYS